MSELRTCPFCGSAAIESVCEPGTAFCNPCTQHILIGVWNTRVPDPAFKRLIETAEAVIRHAQDAKQVPYFCGCIKRLKAAIEEAKK